jgi:hypothetical protein
VWVTLGVALATRLAIIFAVPPGYPGDLAGWVDTAERLTRDGLASAYTVLAPGSLYPAGFMYPLWAAGHLYEWCCSPEFERGTRSLDQVMLLGPVLADSLLAGLVFWLASRFLSPRRALAAGLLYALSPAALTTVAWQGMVGDPYYGALVVGALLAALERRPPLAAALLTLGILIKPQALAFGPLVAVLILGRASPRQVLGALLASGLTVALVLLPFARRGTLDTVGSALQAMTSIHAYTQNSADNLWLLLQVGDPGAKVSYLDGAVPDQGQFFAGLSYQMVGVLLFGAVYAVTLLGLLLGRRSAPSLTVSGAVVGLAFFFFNTRMHVNYSFLAFPFLCVLAAAGRRRVWLALAATTLACLVDWDAFGHWPWPDGLPLHQASAALYGLGLLLVASLALVPASQRAVLVCRRAIARRRTTPHAPDRRPVPIRS